jgi:hypothetical protein
MHKASRTGWTWVVKYLNNQNGNLKKSLWSSLSLKKAFGIEVAAEVHAQPQILTFGYVKN